MIVKNKIFTRILPIAAIIVLMLGLSGCGGQVASLNPTDLTTLGKEMVKIEGMSKDERVKYELDKNAELDSLELSTDANAPTLTAKTYFLLGYLNETAKVTESKGEGASNVQIFRLARNYYKQAAGMSTPYTLQANYRLGILGANKKTGPGEDAIKMAKSTLNIVRTAGIQNGALFSSPTYFDVIVRKDTELAGSGGAAKLFKNEIEAKESTPALYPVMAVFAADRKLDELYQTGGGFDSIKYNAMDGLVKFCKTLAPDWPYVLALLIIAVAVKLITLPLTNKSNKNMQDMQRIQPFLKEVQEKYKDDKVKQSEETMKIMKEHKVNVASGCLPMLIQFPILIVVWQAVNVFAYQFNGSQFFWIKSLALPDMPLLILYALSMYAAQILTPSPSVDPQQKAMQKQMAIMMPIMFFFFLGTIASAFVLYWLFLNILNTVHQVIFMKKSQAAAAAGNSTIEVLPPANNKPVISKSSREVRRKGGK
jgi:YidC/Oxa1 family membrane protein insertase